MLASGTSKGGQSSTDHVEGKDVLVQGTEFEGEQWSWIVKKRQGFFK